MTGQIWQKKTFWRKGGSQGHIIANMNVPEKAINRHEARKRKKHGDQGVQFDLKWNGGNPTSFGGHTYMYTYKFVFEMTILLQQSKCIGI